MWRVLALVVAVGCEPVPAGSMSDLTFPDGFRLDTSVDVAFQVVAGGDAATGVRLDVRTPDGRPLYDGGAALAARHAIGLHVPADTAALDVTAWRGDELVLRERVPIDALRATLHLGGAR